MTVSETQHETPLNPTYWLMEAIILHLDNEGVPVEMEILDSLTFVSMDELSVSMPKIIDNRL